MLLISATIESNALHPQSGGEEPEDAGQTIKTKFGAAVLHPNCLKDEDARELFRISTLKMHKCGTEEQHICIFKHVSAPPSPKIQTSTQMKSDNHSNKLRI